MRIPAETLSRLKDIGVFQPNGLNDDMRVELGGEHFLAADERYAHEIDDAFRVRRRHGGLLVEVAIAEGSQIAGRDDLIETALRKRESRYWGNNVDGMLPLATTRQLELRGPGPHRALVVSQQFSSDASPSGLPDIFPALVRVRNVTPHRLGKHFAELAPTDPVAVFDREFRARYQRTGSVGADASGDRLRGYGNRIIETHMVAANLAVGRWSSGDPDMLIFRTFDPEATDWERLGASDSAAYLTTEPLPHGAFRAMGSTPYPQTTSPLRRAWDLVNGIQIGYKIAGQEPPYASEWLQGAVRQLEA